MTAILGHRGLMLKPAGGGGGSLSTLILADSPIRYWRHAEPSGAVMDNQVGTDGIYVSSPSLAQPAIYAGGPTCFLADSSRYGEDVAALPTASNITVMCVMKPNAVTGIRGIISRDKGSARFWQWRMNGTAMEWVKIVGGVAVVAEAGVFTAGVACLIAVTITSGGAVKFYKDGVEIHSDTIAGADYGMSGDEVQIGYMQGGGGASADAYFSESCIFNTVISGARMAQYAAAAGF